MKKLIKQYYCLEDEKKIAHNNGKLLYTDKITDIYLNKYNPYGILIFDKTFNIF